MQRVLKRIVLHGLLTALILGLVGGLFMQFASLYVATAAPPRMMPVESTTKIEPAPAPIDDTIRYRVPLSMAAWGFAFVAVTELVLFAIRGEKKKLQPAPQAIVKQPDPAEQLLEELLAQADAAMAKEKPASSIQG